MFQAITCSSSGGQIVLKQHLLSSLPVSDRPVHRCTCTLASYMGKLCTLKLLTWETMY